MKCYIVKEKISGFSQAIFAETPAKARYIAYQLEDWTENYYYSFIDFCYGTSYERCKIGDAWYRKDKTHLDWANDEDRKVLCNELGWYCLNETDIDCEPCPAKDVCQRYQDEHGVLEV